MGIGKYISTILVLMMSACQGRYLEVKTTPSDAEISIYNVKGKSFRSLGRSPLKINPDDKLFSLVAENQLLYLSIEKNGFQTEKILLDRDGDDTIEIDINLTGSSAVAAGRTLERQDGQAENAADFNNNSDLYVDRLVRDLNTVLSLINQKQFDLAHASISSLLQKHPKAAAMWDLKGNVDVLRNDLAAAKQSYEQSLTLRPENGETRMMLENLRGH